tara:strand:+ start:515 stop:967 length:453 start_codon:yes stop_codon:yes gene_type:complete
MLTKRIATRCSLDPWKEFRDLESELNRIFSGAFRYLHDTPFVSGYPCVNISKDDNEIVVTADLPGVAADEFEISVCENTLTLKGERKAGELGEGEARQGEGESGKFERTIRLPFRTNADKIKATYENGRLRIELPRSEEDKPKAIPVKVS